MEFSRQSAAISSLIEKVRYEQLFQAEWFPFCRQRVVGYRPVRKDARLGAQTGLWQKAF